MEFQPWPKIARFNRDIVVTEKIDGTNAQIRFVPVSDVDPRYDNVALSVDLDGHEVAMFVGSRKRWLTPGKQTDNYGFAAWCVDHGADLFDSLGMGGHYGEWYGVGIQHGYGMHERRLALFNTSAVLGDCAPPNIDTVPVLYEGPMNQQAIDLTIHHLRGHGSILRPGQDAEGVVVYHKAAGVGFKILCENDETPKGQAVA